MNDSAGSGPDFRKLFESAPGLYLVLHPDLSIAAVSDAYARATMTDRGSIIGQDIFEALPADPDDPESNAERNLRASFAQVGRTGRAHTLPVGKYAVRGPQSAGRAFEARYWSCTNTPVMAGGKLQYIIHSVQDVTEFVRLQKALALPGADRDARSPAPRVEAEIYRSSRAIAKANKELRREREEVAALLRAVTDGVDDVILVKDAAGRYLSINSGGARLLGAPAEEIIGRDDTAFFAPEIARSIRAADSAILADGTPLSYEEEIELDGAMRTFLTTKWPYRDSEGRIVGLVGISKDISERKRREQEIRELNAELEARVALRTADLEAAIKELEAFSYSVSHDLRTPLRSIDGFAKALMEDYGNALDQTATSYVSRVRAASQHMSELIDGMIELSRVARHELVRVPLDLSAMATDIAADLARAQPERAGVRWSIAPGLAAAGDRRLLRAVLENLLGNAWKYTSRHATAHIEFGAYERTEDGTTVYFVRDDGAGFDMNYSAKLFGTFQRMHGASEFPGHGVGLATVQRILRRHAGRIWAEAAVEKGATFFFTLWESLPA